MNDFLYKVRTGKNHRSENKKKHSRTENYNDGDHRNTNFNSSEGILRLISGFYPLYPFIPTDNNK